MIHFVSNVAHRLCRSRCLRFLIPILFLLLLPMVAQSESRSPIEVFVASRCPDCDELEQYLRNWSIPYRRINLEEDPQGERDYLENIGRGILPVGRVNGQIVRGYDMQKWRLIVRDYQRGQHASEASANLDRYDAGERDDQGPSRGTGSDVTHNHASAPHLQDDRSDVLAGIEPENSSGAYHQTEAPTLKSHSSKESSFQKLVPAWPQDEEERQIQAKIDHILASYDALATAQYKLEPEMLDIYKKAGRMAVCNLVMHSWFVGGTPENMLVFAGYLDISVKSVKRDLETKSLDSVVRGLEEELNRFHANRRDALAVKRTNEMKWKAVDDEEKRKDKALSESALGQKLIPACLYGQFAQSFRKEVLTTEEKATIEQKLLTFCTCMVGQCAKRELLVEVENRVVTAIRDSEEIRGVSDQWRQHRRLGHQVSNSDKFGLLILETVDACRVESGMH